MPNYVYDDLPQGTGVMLDTGLGSAPSGFGTQYDQLFQANPYRNLTYKKSFWQQLVSALGFRTDADRWLEDAQVNSAEYDAGIYSMMQQNQFNSPTEQAQRMRAAGMNPDLLGIGDVSQGVKPTEDPNGMSSNSDGSSDLGMVSTIFSTVGSSVIDLIPKTLSFMTSIAQLKGIRMDNDLKELEFGSNAVDAATKFFTEGISKQDYEDAFTSGNFENLLDASQKDAKYLADTYLSSKKARKAFNLAYGMHSRSLVAEMSKYKTYAEYEDARKKNLTQRSSQFFSDDDITQMDLIRSVLGPFEKYQKRINEIQLRISELRSPELEQGTINAGLEAERAYEQNIDGALQAQTENAGNEYQKQLYEIMKATDDMFAEIMQSLNESDKWYSPIAKALVGIARSQLLSGIHLQLGRHSATYTNPTTGAESQSSGFNFGF